MRWAYDFFVALGQASNRVPDAHAVLADVAFQTPADPRSDSDPPGCDRGDMVLRVSLYRREEVARLAGTAIRLRTSTESPIAAEIPVRFSPLLVEPSVVGWRRPVLLLPAGIMDTLTEPQLRAVLIHEICHAHRKDNLLASFHMLVEFLFWFHPLVWWIGADLISVEVPVYELRTEFAGPKLSPMSRHPAYLCPETSPLPEPPSGQHYCMVRVGSRLPAIDAEGVTLGEFAQLLTLALDRPVIDKTEITEKFTIYMAFTPDAFTPRFLPGGDFGAVWDYSGGARNADHNPSTRTTEIAARAQQWRSETTCYRSR